MPRQDGYEMFLGQFSNDNFHFTSLVNYQRHQENAASQLTLNHYRELEEEKGKKSVQKANKVTIMLAMC